MRILTLGMSLYILRVIDRRSPILFCPIPLADFRVKPISFPPPPSLCSVSILVPYNSMIPAQVRCQGCDKAFTPRGLSQHVSKTQNERCRHINNLPLNNLSSPSILYTVSRSPSPPNCMLEVISDDQPSNESRPTINQEFEDVPEFGEVSSSASFMTRVPSQGGDIFLLCIEI